MVSRELYGLATVLLYYCARNVWADLLGANNTSASGRKGVGDGYRGASANYTVSISEVYALRTLYDALSGDTWKWKSLHSVYGNIWEFSNVDINLVNPCTDHWQGVTCDCIVSTWECNIVGLNLKSYGLQGVLPHMGNLTMLSSINLAKNLKLRGDLQPLSNLTMLTYINFDLTVISGDLQPLSNLTLLTYISIAFTVISGDLQPLSNLTLLTYISIAFTVISGDLKPLSSLKMLNTISLDDTAVSGDLQPLSSLTMLSYVFLYGTSVSGDLQPLSSLTMLSDIDLSSTSVSGDLLPLRSLTMLSWINLCDTAISGDLQPLSNLTSLSLLEASHTAICGNLQPLSSLTMLSWISLYDTAISGDLQPLSSLTILNYIALDKAYISGNLKPVSSLTILTTLSLSYTYISGDLQPLSSLKMLYSIVLFETAITGDLQPLSNLTSLSYVSLFNTAIRGNLQPLSNLTMLSYVFLYGTAITGDLRPLSNLSILNTISLFNTAISGDLQPLTTLKMLNNIDLHDTAISGDLQPLDNLTMLSTILLYNTSISGDLSILPSLVNLQYCLLNNNALYGPIPSLIGTSLVYFNVENNYLTGTIDADMFPDSLQVLDIASNQISGMVPNAMLRLPSLQIFDASINCMRLDFTDEVCASSSLHSLILDGLHSSSSCRDEFPVRIYDAIYLQQSNVVLNIPPCIYSLPQLQYLHLSGNGITGTLPEDAALGVNFTELVLTNNEFRSIIPSSFQHHKWSKLDLSYNKFTGGISSNLIVSESVSLKINRLSGNIPTSLYSTSDVSILPGNMFACTSDELSYLHDEVGDSYVCGSSSFDNVSILWLSIVTSGFLVFLLMFSTSNIKSKNCTSSIRCMYVYVYLVFDVIRANMVYTMMMIRIRNAIETISDKSSLSLSNISRFADTMIYVRYASGVLAGVAVCMYMPVYVVLSHYYGTYDHQYMWTVTVAFLSGLNPGIILFVLYIVPLGVLWYHYRGAIEDSLVVYHSSSSKVVTTARLVVVYSLVLLVNLSITIVINGLYVYVFISYGSVVVTLAELFVSLFKVVWTSYALPFLLEVFEDKFLKSGTGSYKHFYLLSIIAIMNNVAIPCLASALVDPNCFYNMIVYPADITSTFYMQTSVSTHIYTSTTALVTTYIIATFSTARFIPSFTYGYQCSSAIVTSYATIFMYSAMLSALLPPVIDTVLDYLRTRNGNQKSRANSLMSVLAPICECIVAPEVVIEESCITKFMLSLVGSVFVLVTFGVVAPVLGFVMFLSIVAQTCYMQYRIGVVYMQPLMRSINASTCVESSADDTCRITVVDSSVGYTEERMDRLRALNSDLQHMDKILCLLVWRAFLFIGIFYGFLLFDIVGDDVGYRKALWAPISFVLVCVAFYITPFYTQQCVSASIVDGVTEKNLGHNNTATTKHQQSEVTMVWTGPAVVMNPVNSDFHSNVIPS